MTVLQLKMQEETLYIYFDTHIIFSKSNHMRIKRNVKARIAFKVRNSATCLSKVLSYCKELRRTGERCLLPLSQETGGGGACESCDHSTM